MRNKLLLGFTVVATVLVTVWRTLVLPATVGNGTTLTHVNYPLLLLMAAVTVVALLLGREKQGYGEATLAPRALLLGGGVFGVVLLVSSLWDVVKLVWRNETPAPLDTAVSTADRMLLSVSMLAGLLGGLFLAVWFFSLLHSPSRPFNRNGRTVLLVGSWVTAVLMVLMFFKMYQIADRALDVAGASVGAMQRVSVTLPLIGAVVASVVLMVCSHRAARRHTFSEKWLWLLLPLWAFCRLARYNVVYAASVDISPAVYELLLYGLILLFLLECARAFTGVQKPSACLRGLAAATAVLAAAACVSRFVLFLSGELSAVAYCPIPSVTEAALALFAAAVAWGMPAPALADVPCHLES